MVRTLAFQGMTVVHCVFFFFFFGGGGGGGEGGRE